MRPRSGSRTPTSRHPRTGVSTCAWWTNDVLLVRKRANIKVQATGGANFEALLEAPLAGGALGTLSVPRGYVDANVRVRGEKVHVVNTHLESFVAATRNAQAESWRCRAGHWSRSGRSSCSGT